MAAEPRDWRFTQARHGATDTVGRPPAACLLGHVHHFALDDRHFEIFHGYRRLFGVYLLPPRTVASVQECAVCGAPLRPVEG
jgi:hypothetical protein